ncbi:hypothetical protein H9Q69_005293 [Fusarium xylarioides]|uniref:ATP synthase subunit K n=1 Tax=Fusarium xylarioides TaxID=221167 RepID=A0A9P7ISM4_9HYPO|nr:hypothetical protein H9Q70_009985 [Fusarium xylarioides]KAG5768568.1 hypothetical protein H9Q72_003963 [Fusarium xylarioides]KAG5778578.1 hypothetical protein H9Q73_007755 [Fusarium xylarioides]KAG5795668.1 hypothetical protein H9Q69_005293 [Fusarium xylarioides]KAG5816314.1 hypothetical protein H9Q71_002406 [Fusarium xylarioides]
MAGSAYYTIAGKQVAGHHLAIAWLGTLVVGTKLALSGGSSKPTATATPPINASSSDEADFIKDFLDQQNKKN